MTSSLDNNTTFNIINNIKNNEFWNKRTYVFVTNNLSLLKYADRVICVERGRMVYLGDFETLKKTPEYQEIYALAKKEEEIEELIENANVNQNCSKSLLEGRRQRPGCRHRRKA